MTRLREAAVGDAAAMITILTHEAVEVEVVAPSCVRTPRSRSCCMQNGRYCAQSNSCAQCTMLRCSRRKRSCYSPLWKTLVSLRSILVLFSYICGVNMQTLLLQATRRRATSPLRTASRVYFLAGIFLTSNPTQITKTKDQKAWRRSTLRT